MTIKPSDEILFSKAFDILLNLNTNLFQNVLLENNVYHNV